MSKSRIAMIDGYDLGAHLGAAKFAAAPTPAPAPEDISQARFDEIKRRVQALVPINDALYSALRVYQAKAYAARAVSPGLVFLVGAYPIEEIENLVDGWHQSALSLMQSDSWIYDTVGDDARYVFFSQYMTKLLKRAETIGDTMANTGILSAVGDFARRFPKSLATTIRYTIDGSGKILREGFGLDLAALKPYLIVGGLLYAATLIVPLIPKRRG